MLDRFPMALSNILKISFHELLKEISEAGNNPNDLIAYAGLLIVEASRTGEDKSSATKLYDKAALLYSCGISALETVPELLEEGTNLALAISRYGYTLHKIGRTEDARRLLESAVQKMPEREELWEALSALP